VGAKLDDAAEFGRIGRYYMYAVEDMLTTEPGDKYGATTLRAHYERVAREGQEYDPYTSVFGSKSKQ
jgi:divinyl chlorophyllide a 8-vinyl-reductase